MTKRNWAVSAETMLDPRRAPLGRHRELLSAIKAGWETGHKPDALTALAQHPELAGKKSIVLELAYEEFCQRRELGEDLDIDRFCERFPLHRTSVRRRLQVHQFVERELCPTTESHWPAPPQSFCGFQLLEEIGQGAIGRVYLARQAAIGGRTVVLKVSEGGSREAHLLGRLQHQNVIPVYSVEHDVESGLTSVCMPLLGLATFEDVLDQISSSDRRPLSGAVFRETLRRMSSEPPASAADTWTRLGRQSLVNALLVQFEQVAEALAYLHSKGICHRDLKPSNILLADDGRPMLLDFNLSAELAASDGRLGGTLPYMAPEQIKGMLGQPTSTLDARADIFSMGVILYEMLTGSLPFGPVSKALSMERAGNLLLERQARGTDVARLKKVRLDCGVVAILEGCLAYDPAARFPDAGAAAAAIRGALRPSPRIKRWVRVHRVHTAAVAVVFATSVALGGVWLGIRKPYFEARFYAGVAAYERGDMKAAVVAFEDSRRAHAEFYPAHVGLAHARKSLGQYLSASEEYQQLYERTRDPKYLASMGYCMGLLGKHREAIIYYGNALAEGYKNEIVLNNLGFSYLRINSFPQARDCLNEALVLNRSYRPALQNRATLELKHAVSKRERIADTAVDDVELAIKQSPGFANMHFVAANIWCRSNRPAAPDAAFDHAHEAVKLGIDPAQFKQGEFFRLLHNDTRFAQLLERRPGRLVAAEPSPTLDPEPRPSFDFQVE